MDTHQQLHARGHPSDVDRLRSRARRRFRTFYPGGFDDPDYLELERGYKQRAHELWSAALPEQEFARLLGDGDHGGVARRAVGIESRTNLLFSFEKMALRDAVKEKRGARVFSEGLYALLHGEGSPDDRFAGWIDAVARLPRRQTRVLTWPVLTVFPFIADPKRHIYLKPTTTKAAAARWGFPFAYASKPSVPVYRSLLAFGKDVRAEHGIAGKPRDQIDVQGFLWVLGSTEYD